MTLFFHAFYRELIDDTMALLITLINEMMIYLILKAGQRHGRLFSRFLMRSLSGTRAARRLPRAFTFTLHEPAALIERRMAKMIFAAMRDDGL